MRVCLALVLVLAHLVAVPAHADAAFALRYSANLYGGVARAANSIVTCSSEKYGPVSCAQAQAGAVRENYPYWMTFIDADTDQATFDSSSAVLDLRPGDEVAYARLYWGCLLEAEDDSPDLPAGNRLAPDPAAKGTVKLKVPGSGGYATVTAAASDVVESTISGNPVYQASADVTGLVKGAGGGAYWVADVQAARGDGGSNCSGWTLVAAYARPGDKPRNIAIFDGLVEQSASAPPLTLNLSGFQTPRAGPIAAQVGIVAYEGDADATGDSATIQTAKGPATVLSNAVNPADDVFNSTITTLGAQTRSRTPAYLNTLGYDSDVFDASQAFRNGDTSMRLTLATDGDAYLPGVVFTQIDLLRPRVFVAKRVSARVVRPGQRVRYTITLTNPTDLPYAGARVHDDLSGVLDDADYHRGSSALSLTRSVLTWAGTVPAHRSVTLGYTVTARWTADGDHRLRNAIVRPACGDACRTNTVVSRRPACRSGADGRRC